MRILIISQYFWPENFRINDLAAEFSLRGHDVTILTGYPNYPSGAIFPEFRKDTPRYQSFGTAKVVRIPLLARGTSPFRLLLNYASFAVSASLFGPWRLRGQTFDVIFVFEPSPITVGIPATVLRRLKRAPVAFWVLDLWPETLAAVGAVRSRHLLKAIGRLVSYIYDRCDLILAQSKSFIPAIRSYCRQPVRVEYFPSWSDTAFDAANTEPAPEIVASQNFFNVMFAGNIGDAQDFPAILDAAEILKTEKRVRWLMVGDGRAANWVRGEIAQRGLAHCVLMLGRHPVERMPSLYAHADALLVSLKDTPIFSTTIPGKLQSYLASGIPVLAMLNGEGAEIVRASGSGLTCPAGDGRALAEAVGRMMRMSAAELAEMGSRGKALTQSDFDRETLITKLLSWLADLADARDVGTRAQT